MTPFGIATYLPAWADAKGRPVLGPDEDAVTLAVSAALPLVDRARAAGVAVERVVTVSRQPGYLEGNTTRVLHRALDLGPAVVVEERLGGGPAALEAVANARAGTLVVAVDVEPAAAAAVLVGAGPGVEHRAGVERGLPITTRLAGTTDPRVYEDPRLLREHGWRPVVTELAAGSSRTALAGLPAKDARALLGAQLVEAGTGRTGTSAPLFALADLAVTGGGEAVRLVAVEQGVGTAVDVALAAGEVEVLTVGRPPIPAPRSGFAPRVPGDIPMALPAYARAFDSKVGLIGRRCACGQLQFPPRTQCLECGRIDETIAEALPRKATVYSVVTVHPPVPGLYGPYSIVVAELDGAGLRVLTRVTDVDAGSVAIGAEGSLVLRRAAVREGIPDYDYAFQPNGVSA